MTLVASPPTGTLCEIAKVMAAAHNNVFGHWAGDDAPDGHVFCGCPNPIEAIGARLGVERGERLVVLLTKFAYQVHTPDEQTEMFALIKEAPRQ